MSVETCYRLRCDQCNSTLPVRANEHLATQAGRIACWLSAVTAHGQGVTVHLCPQCAKAQRPEWWPKEEET
jgi:hypothetical protein